jgi:hypothetical protein
MDVVRLGYIEQRSRESCFRGQLGLVDELARGLEPVSYHDYGQALAYK